MNWARHGGSTTFETKSSYCRVAQQGLPCYTAVARIGFKRRATAVLKSNLIRSIEFGTAVARRLKRALLSEFYTDWTTKTSYSTGKWCRKHAELFKLVLNTRNLAEV